jgi:ferritin-like metal-binding protein YciE
MRFEAHLEQTQGHVQCLETIFESLKESPKGKKCVAMEGLVKEGTEVTEEDFEGSVSEATLINYEIAAYGTVCESAKVLEETKHASFLERTLEEEMQTDEKLTKLAKEINAQANQARPPKELDEAQTGRRTPKRGASLTR